MDDTKEYFGLLVRPHTSAAAVVVVMVHVKAKSEKNRWSTQHHMGLMFATSQLIRQMRFTLTVCMFTLFRMNQEPPQSLQVKTFFVNWMMFFSQCDTPKWASKQGDGNTTISCLLKHSAGVKTLFFPPPKNLLKFEGGNLLARHAHRPFKHDSISE